MTLLAIWASLALWGGYRGGLFHFPSLLKIVNITGWEVLRGFFTFLLIQLSLGPLIASAYLYLGNKTSIVGAWMHVGLVVGSFGGILLVYFSLSREKREALWGEKRKYQENCLFGAVGWLIGYPLVMSIGALIALFFFPNIEMPDQIAVKLLKKTLDSPLLFGATALSVIFLVPFSEEFLFRGLLQNWLKQKISAPAHVGIHRLWPIVITSLIFAFAHYSPAQEALNWQLLPSLFTLSLFLGFLYERQGSLLASISLHAIYNGMTILFIIML